MKPKIFILVSGGSLLLSAPAVAEQRLPLARAVQQAQVVAIVQVNDPSAEQTAVAGSGAGVAGYYRHRWRLTVVRVLQRTLKVAPTAGSALLVDQFRWRADLAEHLRCQGKQCHWPEKPMLDTQLSRPPRAGQQVLALLRQTADGWQLAVDAGFDHPERAAELANPPAAKAGRGGQ
ncbi:MAG: hypothetical protein EXR77_02520 [Myxococcales bacterium]|nr:hypothetical protein [Myxococcales bacterium]